MHRRKNPAKKQKKKKDNQKASEIHTTGLFELITSNSFFLLFDIVQLSDFFQPHSQALTHVLRPHVTRGWKI